MILIDGNPILYRSHFTYDLHTNRGEPSNIIYGSLKILLGLMRQLPRHADGVTVFWDKGRSRYRSERYPQYKRTPNRKANREKPGYPEGSFETQTGIVWNFLKALGVRQVGVQTVEADDCIAIVTGLIPNCVVVSDDMDLWQLIGQNGTQVYAPRKELWLRTREDCHREIGIWPEQIPDYKSLAGDSSDNIPGVPSVGEKTAKELLSTGTGTHPATVPQIYHSLRAVESGVTLSAKVRKILDSEEQVKMWFDLCQPLSWNMLDESEKRAFTATWQGATKVDRVELVALLERWELHSLLKDTNAMIEAFHGPMPASLLRAPIVGFAEGAFQTYSDPEIQRQGIVTVPYAKGSDTSEAAAQDVEPHAPRMRRQVCDYIVGCGEDGATCDAVEVALSMPHQTASPRVNELARAGQIVDSGERRPTRSGSAATVWKAAGLVRRQGMKVETAATYQVPTGTGRERLSTIAQNVLSCSACTMRAECSRPVPGNLEDDSERPWGMILGRNPGASEDREGRGFVGRAGQRLNQWFDGHDGHDRKVAEPLPVRRKKGFVSNVAKCFSAGNRPPTEAEWTSCAALHLREEVRAIEPRLILSFGTEAMTALTGFDDSIMARAGTTVPGKEAEGVVQYLAQDGERRWDPVIHTDATIFLLPHPAATFRARDAEMKFQQCGRIVEQWLRDNGFA